ncbi:MAG: helix-turn-helix domain-containing protein [Pseudobutyrivibrio sp.]|nr:helix-turn-helix domain-containing protein [Pseudobutyrivibrio sp.]
MASKPEFIMPDHITGADIKRLRRLLGYTQAVFADFAGVSQKTVERWESSDIPITGPIVTLYALVMKDQKLASAVCKPAPQFDLRIYYMLDDDICSIIDVDEHNQKVVTTNYSDNPIKKAFGCNEHPTYKDYEDFLESRCFPRTRDKMKIQLAIYDLPFYDPMRIIEKTEGRCAEDRFWIRMERYDRA